jgi:hypothetical protein
MSVTTVLIGPRANVLRFVAPLAVIACLAVGCNSVRSNTTGTTVQSADRAIGADWAFPSSRISVTYGDKGMVSTTDRVASEIGAEVIRRGGNASMLPWPHILRLPW